MSKKEMVVAMVVIIILLAIAICIPAFAQAGIGGTVKHTKNWHEYRPFDNGQDMKIILDEGRSLKPGECIIFDRHRVCKIPKGMTFKRLCRDFYGVSDKETIKEVWDKAFANRELSSSQKIFAGEVFILPKDLIRD